MRAGLVKRGAPALLRRGGRVCGRQACRGTPVANGNRDRRPRPFEEEAAVESSGAQAGEGPTPPTECPSILSVVAELAAAPTRERLHYFVETDELRRLLCLMAGTELLSELCRRLQTGDSSGEV
jgi:hypothetical protein